MKNTVLDSPLNQVDYQSSSKRKQQKRSQTRRRQKVIGLVQFCLAMGIGFGLFHFFQHPLWYITDIQVQGLNQYNRRFILNYLSHQELTDRHLLLLNPQEIQKELLSYPMLKSVQINRYLWPSQLVVQLQGRQPVFRIYLENNTYTEANSILIDEEGTILPISPTIHPQSKLLLSLEPSQTKKITPEILTTIAKLKDYYSSDKIAIEGVFNLSQLNNVILRTPSIPVPVWLGTLDDLTIKMGLLSSLQSLIEQYKSQVEYIDLRYWKHPVLKTTSSVRTDS